MIKKLIADNILKCADLSEEDTVILKYGLSKLWLLLEDTIITLALGFFLDMIVECLIFQISFILLRMYAGGCHSKTEQQCKVHSMFITVVSLISIKFTPNLVSPIIAMTMMFSLVVIFLAPVESSNKPLTTNEKLFNRKMTIVIILILNVITVIGYFMKYAVLYKPISIAILVVSILMLFGKIKNSF